MTVKVFSYNTQTHEFNDFDTDIILHDEFYIPGPEGEGGLTAESGVVVESDEDIMLYMNRINSDEIVEYHINPTKKTVDIRINNDFISPTGFAVIDE